MNLRKYLLLQSYLCIFRSVVLSHQILIIIVNLSQNLPTICYMFYTSEVIELIINAILIIIFLMVMKNRELLEI